MVQAGTTGCQLRVGETNILERSIDLLRPAVHEIVFQFSRIPLLGLLVKVPAWEKVLAFRDAAIIGILGTAALWLPGAFQAVHLSVPVSVAPIWFSVRQSLLKGDFLLLCPSMIAPALLLFFVPSGESRGLRSHQQAILGLAILICVLTLLEFAIFISAGIKDTAFLTWTSNWLLSITLVILYFLLLLQRVPNDAAAQAQVDEDELLDALMKKRGTKQ
jgi:hypothetical protein